MNAAVSGEEIVQAKKLSVCSVRTNRSRPAASTSTVPARSSQRVHLVTGVMGWDAVSGARFAIVFSLTVIGAPSLRMAHQFDP